MSRDQALRRLDKESHINAGRQLLPEAGAQRTLSAVSCTPWFGCDTPNATNRPPSMLSLTSG